MNILIRELKDSDIPVLLPHLQEMFVMHDTAEPDLFEPHSFSTEQIEEYLGEALTNENEKVFIAEVDGKLAGTIRAEIKTPPTFYKHKKIGYLDDLVVLQDFRRKGIAKALIEKASDYLHKKDISIIELKIYEFNDASQSLVKSIGFKKTFSYFYKKIKTQQSH